MSIQLRPQVLTAETAYHAPAVWPWFEPGEGRYPLPVPKDAVGRYNVSDGDQPCRFCHRAAPQGPLVRGRWKCPHCRHWQDEGQPDGHCSVCGVEMPCATHGADQ